MLDLRVCWTTTEFRKTAGPAEVRKPVVIITKCSVLGPIERNEKADKIPFIQRNKNFSLSIISLQIIGMLIDHNVWLDCNKPRMAATPENQCNSVYIYECWSHAGRNPFRPWGHFVGRWIRRTGVRWFSLLFFLFPLSFPFPFYFFSFCVAFRGVWVLGGV